VDVRDLVQTKFVHADVLAACCGRPVSLSVPITTRTGIAATGGWNVVCTVDLDAARQAMRLHTRSCEG
jgi:hypothetical protein